MATIPATGSRRTRAGTKRFTLLPLIAGAAYFGLADSAATVVAKVDAVRAHALAPWDGRITAQAAEETMLLNSGEGGSSRSAELARQALRQDPTAVVALNVLGLLAQIENDTEGARRIFAYSLELSRRELPARLWAIEEAVGRGDIGEALVNYDIALTTSKRAPDALFPVLASAIAEPKVRERLIGMMRRGTTWGEAFIHYAAASGGEPQVTAAFLRAAGQARLPVQDGDRTRVVDAFFNRRMQAEAWAWYASFRAGAKRTQLRNGRFTLQPDTPSVFDWRSVDTPGITASIQAAERGGLVDIFIAPSASGPMLSQTQALQPGRYRLSGKVSGLDGEENARPYWTVICSDGREAARIVLEPSQSGAFEGDFSIQQGCQWQALTLMARSSGNVSGLAGQVESVSIKPVRGTAGS